MRILNFGRLDVHQPSLFLHDKCESPSGIVISDTDCCAVRPGFESRRAMDVCKCIVSLWHEDTLNSHRVASPLLRSVVGVEKWESPDSPRVFFLKIGVEQTLSILSLEWWQWLTTCVHIALSWVSIWHRQTGGISNNNMINSIIRIRSPNCHNAGCEFASSIITWSLHSMMQQSGKERCIAAQVVSSYIKVRFQLQSNKLEQALPQHLLECLGLDWEDIHNNPLLESDLLKVNGFTDLWSDEVRSDGRLATTQENIMIILII
ncbi:hypothetical protein TNCV_1241411 [Trichonephila clavipes]|uniref:Uncharacterized protein n=1 Tax=Trichonephila clavipes TaxID=2585209 RepID=A0A8X6WFL5_TRICX|nr:hypothetical protein TNCV_1241411 [Trichonephila clavipes]